MDHDLNETLRVCSTQRCPLPCCIAFFSFSISMLIRTIIKAVESFQFELSRVDRTSAVSLTLFVIKGVCAIDDIVEQNIAAFTKHVADHFGMPPIKKFLGSEHAFPDSAELQAQFHHEHSSFFIVSGRLIRMVREDFTAFNEEIWHHLMQSAFPRADIDVVVGEAEHLVTTWEEMELIIMRRFRQYLNSNGGDLLEVNDASTIANNVSNCLEEDNDEENSQDTIMEENDLVYLEHMWNDSEHLYDSRPTDTSNNNDNNSDDESDDDFDMVVMV